VVCLDWVFKNNLNRLGHRLSVCEGKLFSMVCSLLNLHCFFRNLLKFKFLGVLLLQMIFFILERRNFNQLHTLMLSLFRSPTSSLKC
jgi:hypothetical protein